VIELGTHLDDCTLLYDEGSFWSGIDKELHENATVYINNNRSINIKRVHKHVLDICGDEAPPPRSVWLDTRDNQFFSDAQYVTLKNAKKEQHFFVPAQNKYFENILEEYNSTIVDKIDVFKTQELVFDDAGEFFISNVDNHFNRYTGKKIMIVCGGPSANEVDWQAVDYDYLWTCNEFYKNDKLQDVKIDFAALASVVDLDNKELNDIMRRDAPIISFPLVTYLYDQVPLDPVKSFVERYPSNSCHWYTRYSSVIGTGVRMIALAIFSGAKDVYFVGVDGRNKVEKDGKLLHAFNSKKRVPKWYNLHGDRFQARQNLIFWDYIFHLKHKYEFNIYNLGEEKKYNTLATVSRTLCPLPDTIKRKIGAA